MNYKTVQRVHKLYEELKALDTEIIQIDKLAVYIANNKASIDLRITAEKNKADQADPVLDSDGSLLGAEKRMYQTFFDVPRYAFLTGSTTLPKPDFDLSYNLHEGLCLAVLDVLIRDLNTKRKVITDELRGIFNR